MKKYFPSLEYMNIPNMVTTLGLVSGVTAGYFLVEGSMRGAFLFLAFAMLMDLVDGFLAAKLNQQSRFGQYLDSLVDFFICCIMPGLLLLTFVENSALFVAAAAFVCICGLWRLAYFNVTAGEKRTYFTGMPVPGGALIGSMAMWLVVYYGFPAWVAAAAFFVAGLMMVAYIKLEKYGLWQKAMWAIGLAFAVLVVFS